MTLLRYTHNFHAKFGGLRTRIRANMYIHYIQIQMAIIMAPLSLGV